MVAGAIHALGVPMGDKDLPQNIEDPPFNPDYIRPLENEDKREHFLSTVREKITQRNADHDTWGWKYPRVNRYLADIITDLRNPRLVVVYRDPVPASLRLARRRSDDPEKRQKDLFSTITLRLQIMQQNTAMVEQLAIPTLMVSYERAIARKLAFIDELADFIGKSVPRNIQPLLDFMEPGTYKPPIEAAPQQTD